MAGSYHSSENEEPAACVATGPWGGSSPPMDSASDELNQTADHDEELTDGVFLHGSLMGGLLLDAGDHVDAIPVAPEDSVHGAVLVIVEHHQQLSTHLCQEFTHIDLHRRIEPRCVPLHIRITEVSLRMVLCSLASSVSVGPCTIHADVDRGHAQKLSQLLDVPLPLLLRFVVLFSHVHLWLWD